MKIICTGPNGERFEGEANVIHDLNGKTYEDKYTEIERRNNIERAAVQKALETWCKIVGAKISEAQEIPTTQSEAFELFQNSRICKTCGFSLATHRSGGLLCPKNPSYNARQISTGCEWATTSFKE